ncbi:hypothetical protein [Azorhizobium sp. AG788]|uniref:hypothetical protein n=1 Tax=Azorhizobium sp. AG788 TaxID=2183897 RepID=UPI00313A124F
MTLADLHHAIIEDAIERVQPIMMPVVAITIAGLISILEQRRSLRDHAAYRRADDRWHGFFALMTLVAISAIQAPSRDGGRCPILQRYDRGLLPAARGRMRRALEKARPPQPKDLAKGEFLMTTERLSEAIVRKGGVVRGVPSRGGGDQT